MNIEDIRFLLTALIQTIPTVYSLALIAIFAIPKSRKKILKDQKKKLLLYLIIITAFVGGVLISNIWALANLQYYFSKGLISIQMSITLSAIVLFIIPIFLAVILITFGEFELKDEKNLKN